MAGMDTLARSHRRAVWLIVALLLAFVVGLVGYELNWIHQRRLAWAKRERLPYSWADFYPQFPGSLPARGVGPLDRLVMRLLNERERDYFLVIYPGFDPSPLPTDDVLEETAEVRRAHWLFPEATIAVEFLALPAFTSSEPSPAP